MIDMTNCTNVTMWFIPIKFFLRHYFFFLTLFFNFLERVKGIEPLHPAWKASVLPLNYTRVTKYFTPSLQNFIKWWRGKDSNLRRPKSTGLQPAPFDRFGTPPPKSRGSAPLLNKALNNMRFIYFN